MTRANSEDYTELQKVMTFYDQLRRTDLIDWTGLNVVWYDIH